jgi:hypothetical protein
LSHKKAKNQKKKGRGTTTLQQHKQVKKTLLPPLMQLGVTLTSWTEDKLPEMLWADCLLTNYRFNQAGGIFHKTVDIIDEFYPEDSKVIVTGLVSSFSLVPEDKRAEVRRVLAEEGLDEAVFPEAFKHAISLYEQCPMGWLFEDWRRTERVDFEIGVRYMKEAAKRLLASKSKHSTRCRMFALSRMVKRGKIIFVKGAMDDLIEDLCAYSDSMAEEGQQRVEASIRAMFGGYFDMPGGDVRAWPAYFWRHNYKISVCEQVKDSLPEMVDATAIIRRSVARLREALSALKTAYEQAILRAELDLYAPDRDEVLFGLMSRQFRMFSVLIDDPKLWAPDLGLMFHRVMADTQIVLAYLIHKSDPELYERYKRYSLGKQKLYKLHLTDYGERTGLDMSEVEEDLEERINSEIFEEFLPIELGSVFEGTDMRKMAYDVKLEDLYRLVYSPTSAELHGEWVSLKEHNLTLCVNPLHRYHRLPKLQSEGLVSTGIVLRATSILAETLEAWLRAYGLESQYGSALDAFREAVADAFEEPAAQAATSS